MTATPKSAPPSPLRPDPPGGVRLVLSPASVRAGQCVSADTTGSTEGFIQGIYVMLETEIEGEWRSIYYLTVTRPGGKEPQAIPLDREVRFARVGRRVGPYRLLVPPVEPGAYRVRQDISHLQQNLHVTLYASLIVVR